MSGWVHEEEHDHRLWCLLSCQEATPDMTSPCGFLYVGEVRNWTCDQPGDSLCHQPPCWPPYIPTLCRCGHGIRRAG